MINLNSRYKDQPTVGAVFRNTKYAEGHEQVYTYMVDEDLDPHVGDLGIVEKDGIYSIVTIRVIHDGSRVDIDAPYRYKWIVGLIDPIPYNDMIAAEDKMLAEVYADSPSRV